MAKLWHQSQAAITDKQNKPTHRIAIIKCAGDSFIFQTKGDNWAPSAGVSWQPETAGCSASMPDRRSKHFSGATVNQSCCCCCCCSSFAFWLLRISQNGPINRPQPAPSDAPAAPLPPCHLSVCPPLLIYSNVDAWRCLSTLFICIFFGFLLALSLFCCINRS